MKNWILGFLFVLALSFDGWGCGAPEMPVDGEPNFGFTSPQLRLVAEEAKAKAPVWQDDGVLYLTAPDPFVQDMLYSVAEFYSYRLNVQIAVVPEGGRPVLLADLPDYPDEQVVGNAYSEGVWCAGSACSNPDSNVEITLDALLWQTNSYSLSWHVLAHEVGHLISGWGMCYTGTDVDPTGSHLGSRLHIMSAHSTLEDKWDELDDELVCSCGEC